MSIARRLTVRRLLGTGAASLTLCAASAAAASGAFASTGTPGGDGWKSGGQYQPGTGAGTETQTDRCEFSLDGTNFYKSVRVDDQNLKPTEDGKIHVKVRAAGDASTCTASLASYLAHGASFGTSGEQVFVDFDSVTVKHGQTDTLDISVPDAGCYAQIDLYRGAVKFDGKLDAKDGFVHGDLPKGPDRPVIKDKLIAAWNGGTKDCTVTEQPPSSPPAGGGGAPSPSASTPSEPSEPSEPAESASESTSPSPSAPESESSTPTPSASESTSAPAPTPNGGGGDLAETGADSNTPLIAGGAAALLAGGAAIVVATRRRKALRG